jgi:hypothetical protein
MDGRAVRVGMMVRDADGRRLGRVTRCDPWGFEVVRGFFGPREWVIRYDEVLEVRGDELCVARSDEDLLELAAGRLPRSWRRDVLPAPLTLEAGAHRHG